MIEEEYALLEKYLYLTGRKFTFDDGAEIRVVHVKMRPDGCNVMYEASWNGALPRRFVTHVSNFLDTFKHLFPEIPSE